jgi:hypothetical protein
MKRFQIEMAGVLVIFALVAVPGWAGPKHYVASYGLDSNPCTLDSPCRSFAHAVSVTDPGGEVVVLDTGGYGSVTITKSISLIAPVGIYASVTVASGTDGIVINAGAYDTVLIKGLTIKGTSGSLIGISTSTVGTLIVDSCFISGLEYIGIDFPAPDSKLVILNSKIYNSSMHGVRVRNTSGSVFVSMNNVEMINNYFGLSVCPQNTGSISATVTNSLANQNYIGFTNCDNSSGTSVLNLEHCIAARNDYAGIQSNNTSAAHITRLSNCTVMENWFYGIYRPGLLGTIYTRGNNTVAGNGTDSNVTPTAFSAW